MANPVLSLLNSAKQQSSGLKLAPPPKAFTQPIVQPQAKTVPDDLKQQIVQDYYVKAFMNSNVSGNLSNYGPLSEGLVGTSEGNTDVPQTLGSNSSYLDYIAKKESGGDYSAKNLKSSASGKYQFIDSTLDPYLKQLGTTKSEYLSNPEIQEKVASMHLDSILSELKRRNIPLTNKNVYGAWQQGVGGLVNALKGIAPSGDALLLNVPSGQPKTLQGLMSYW